MFTLFEHGGDKEIIEKLVSVAENAENPVNLDESKTKLCARINLQKLAHICDFKGCKDWIPIEKDVYPKPYTTVRDFLIQNASENASLHGQPSVDRLTA